MRRSDFYYDLPEALIAQAPPAKRTESRLLYLDGAGGEMRDLQFPDVLTLVNPGDLMVFNDTKVIPARIYGRKASGGKVEVLIERLLDVNKALAHIKASKSPKPGSKLILDGDLSVSVIDREGALFVLQFHSDRSIIECLELYGHIPLPPYIKREDQQQDKDRYQTVYAKTAGAVAAPTAGLHFDEPLISVLRDKGVDSAYITLHVGAGTFQPVRVDNIHEHQMHSEYAEISAQVCERISAAKSRGNRVIAVGTTTVRCLETAAASGHIQPYKGLTNIFIKPGTPFHIVDAMITNFHLPESTLLMLVCAFAGYDQVMSAYRHAVEKNYRFFSYGDAMFLTKKSV
ncbi:tRNA preQ1(34) S-adenosylmethionine ribosyltransferase-isomerase QueA [Kaarinaea lacus]